jgi:hypothetical protein
MVTMINSSVLGKMVKRLMDLPIALLITEVRELIRLIRPDFTTSVVSGARFIYMFCPYAIQSSVATLKVTAYCGRRSRILLSSIMSLEVPTAIRRISNA